MNFLFFSKIWDKLKFVPMVAGRTKRLPIVDIKSQFRELSKWFDMMSMKFCRFFLTDLTSKIILSIYSISPIVILFFTSKPLNYVCFATLPIPMIFFSSIRSELMRIWYAPLSYNLRPCILRRFFSNFRFVFFYLLGATSAPAIANADARFRHHSFNATINALSFDLISYRNALFTPSLPMIKIIIIFNNITRFTFFHNSSKVNKIYNGTNYFCIKNILKALKK